MKGLYNYITKQRIDEGGASGHMKHIIDYDELTLDNLKGIIYSLFAGRVEHMTEKVDGTNIQASMNNAGEVVFVRNKGDLNSERGGMSVDDMVTKWQGKDKVQQTFVESGRVLEQVFKRLGASFFNPDPVTRIFVNCECMIAGTTNIIPYITAKVNVHDLWIYKKNADGWEHIDTTKDGLIDVELAMKDIDSAQLTPEVIIKVTKEGEQIRNRYFVALNKAFKDAGLRNKNTVAEYKFVQYNKWIDDNAPWIKENNIVFNNLFQRWVYANKKIINLKDIKKVYNDHLDELMDIENNRVKELNRYCTVELDNIFLNLGNDIISLCSGFINDGHEAAVVGQLQKELQDVIDEIEHNEDTKEAAKTELLNQLNRLDQLSGINATEGIVFNYKGRLMKLTGAFAPLNAILNLKYRYK